MKKICIIGNVASMIVNFRKELIIDLISKGYIVYCFAYGYTLNEKKLVNSWGAIPRDHFLDLNGVNPFKDIRGMYLLYKEIKKIKPDIVFNTFIKPVIFGTIVAKLAKVTRIVGMIEGLGNAFTVYPEGETLKTKYIKYIQICLYKISLPLLSHVIVLNSDDYKDLIDRYSINVKKVTVLGGIGVDLDRFSYSEVTLNKEVTFIFVARLLREKGVFEFLDSAKLIKEKYPLTKFILLGGFDKNNPYSLSENSLDFYIKNNIVSYLGHVANVLAIIKDSSVFVLPSFYREGVPRSTQEAMAIGRAVITTDVPGCRETVEDGVNGFLVKPYSAEEIAEKMIYFIQNPQKILSMGIASREIAERKFNIKKVNKKLISIISGDDNNSI
ncbi:glycosyltransferase family 4 protein [Glaesserella parasuis]|uniref:glycosyltransferase family 4 protein n=1 Tax=Glaesserella parasuis TaxID=738 RepID=UPI00243656C3|nr:glycosyltransferase family 4 protein [Glaesserella parasuis]MDG6317591.1 glycosyltransferase family 4 protein [Glaesserella parasuis]